MFHIDPLSRKPVYEQLIEQLEKFVLTDLLKAETQLPSVRSLSLELSINPNTIQKAYKLLEEEGLIQSHSGAKSYMILDELKIEEIRTELLENDAKNAVKMLKQMGITLEEAISLIEKHWN